MVNHVREYQTLVSLAQLKLHDTATVTLALQNIAMSLPAADYYGHPRAQQRHEHAFFEDVHSFIAAMARLFAIGLAVIVGHPAMIGTGPLGGDTVETGLVIASTDAVAADMVGTKLLGWASARPSGTSGKPADWDSVRRTSRGWTSLVSVSVRPSKRSPARPMASG
jgi:uncharacterized protein (DUF362 family)